MKIIAQLFLGLFLLPFAGFGGFAIYSAFQLATQGRYREALIPAVIGLIFCFFGFGGIWFLLFRANKKTKEQLVQEKSPSTPWLWREDWAAGRAKGMMGTRCRFFWLFTIFWNFISWPIVFSSWNQLVRDFSHGQYVVLVACLFPLIGLGLLFYTLRLTLRLRKFGEPELLLSTVPAPVGGTLDGKISLPQNCGFMPEFELKLLCVEQSRSGNNSNTETVVWQGQQKVAADSDGSISVHFEIPPDARETYKVAGAFNTVTWRLQVSSKTPGIDFFEQYEVPIFKTELTQEQQAHLKALEATEEAHFQEQLRDYQLPANTHINIRQLPTGETEFFFGAGRNFSVAGTLLIFLLFCLAPVVFSYFSKGFGAKIFGFFGGLIGLIFLYSILRTLFGTYHVVVGTGEVRVTRRLLGFGGTRIIAVSAIDGISLASNFKSGQTSYYDIEIELQDETKVTAGSMMKDKVLAQYLADEMKRHLGTGSAK